MAFGYSTRQVFTGNERLSIGTLASDGEPTAVIHGTGLVSVSAMEDSSEATNVAADNVPDHVSFSAAPTLTGSMVFVQLDPGVRTDFFGQEVTANGSGYASSGVYPKRIVQYVSPGQTRGGEPLLLVTVYPNMSVTAKPTKETTTNTSDAPDEITWTGNVQATPSPYYLTTSGRQSAEFEYIFKGADVAKVLDFIDGGGIITPSYTPTP